MLGTYSLPYPRRIPLGYRLEKSLKVLTSSGPPQSQLNPLSGVLVACFHIVYGFTALQPCDPHTREQCPVRAEASTNLLTDRRIRLLRMAAGRRGDPITSLLLPVSLEELPSYAALS